MRCGCIPIIFMAIGWLYCDTQGLTLPGDSSTATTATAESTHSIAQTNSGATGSTSPSSPLSTAATTEQSRTRPNAPNNTDASTTGEGTGTEHQKVNNKTDVDNNRTITDTTGTTLPTTIWTPPNITQTVSPTGSSSGSTGSSTTISGVSTTTANGIIKPYCRQGNCTGNETCLSSDITDTCELFEDEYCYQIVHAHEGNMTHYIEVGCRTDCEHLVETADNDMGTLTSTTRCCDTDLCNQELLADPNERGATSPIAYSFLALFSTLLSIFILE